MSVKSRLDKLYADCKRITFDPSAKILFISDTHWGRGQKDKADDFFNRRDILLYLLDWAYKKGYFVFILGDWLELYENDSKKEIFDAYPSLWSLVQKFDVENRLYVIEGNHDKGLGYAEAYVLYLNGVEYFVFHSHQTDSWNYGPMWYVSKWFVRYVWRGLQYIGMHDPTEHDKKRHVLSEQLTKEWAKERKVKTITGHTHCPKQQGLYQNDGAFVGSSYAYILFDNQNGMVLYVDKLPI